MPPSGQGLWIYLLTNPNSSPLPGLFRAGRLQLAEELGWEIEDFDRCAGEILSAGMAFADWRSRVIYLPNAIAYNEPENPNVVAAWRAALEEIPACELRDRAAAAIEAYLSRMGETWLCAWTLSARRGASGPQKVRLETATAVKARDGNHCRYCGCEVDWTNRRGSGGGTFDHIDPSGPGTDGNVVVACRGCSGRKGFRTPEQAGMKLNRVGFRAKEKADPDPIRTRSSSRSRSDLDPNKSVSRQQEQEQEQEQEQNRREKEEARTAGSGSIPEGKAAPSTRNGTGVLPPADVPGGSGSPASGPELLQIPGAPAAPAAPAKSSRVAPPRISGEQAVEILRRDQPLLATPKVEAAVLAWAEHRRTARHPFDAAYWTEQVEWLGNLGGVELALEALVESRRNRYQGLFSRGQGFRPKPRPRVRDNDFPTAGGVSKQLDDLFPDDGGFKP